MNAAPPASQLELRRAWLRERWDQRQSSDANQFRAALLKWYGDERGKWINCAEVYEICEFGHQPTENEIRRLFPFF